jgi:hypothetical protein
LRKGEDHENEAKKIKHKRNVNVPYRGRQSRDIDHDAPQCQGFCPRHKVFGERSVGVQSSRHETAQVEAHQARSHTNLRSDSPDVTIHFLTLLTSSISI